MKTLIFFLALLPALAVELAWQPNPAEDEVTHYELSYGVRSGEHTVTLMTENTSIKVEGLEPQVVYYFVVRAVNADGLKSEPSEEISHQVAIVRPPLERVAGTTVHAVSSAEPGLEGARALDGLPNTFWHTAFTGAAPKHPHELTIALGAIRRVGGLGYLPRQDQFSIGNVGDFEILTSLDGQEWSLVAQGRMGGGKAGDEIMFATAEAAFVRFRALSCVEGSGRANAAELVVLAEPAVVPPAPPAPKPPEQPKGLRVVEIQTSSNLVDWTTVAFVPLQPGQEFVRARVTELGD